MLQKLIAIEWLKTRRRFAFFAAMLFWFGLVLLMSGIAYYTHRTGRETSGVTLPNDWKQLASVLGSMMGMTMIILVSLLTASERTWRTERQNVIDGLSRNQYFAGKLLLLMMLSVLMWAGSILIITTFGVLDRGITPSDAPWFDALSMKVLAGLLLRAFVVGSMAFFFSMVTSGSGAALAFSIVFLMAQEPLVLLLADKADIFEKIAPYSLGKILDGLTNSMSWDAVTLQKMNAQIEKYGFSSPMMSGPRSVLIASVYAALFSAGAWLSIRRRDL
jgi:ABC-2 type transport system permease protein